MKPFTAVCVIALVGLSLAQMQEISKLRRAKPVIHHVHGDLVLSGSNQAILNSRIDGDLKIEGFGQKKINVSNNSFNGCAYDNGNNLFAEYPSLLDKGDE